MRETFQISLDYLINTFNIMNLEVKNFFGHEKKYSELTLGDFERLKEEYNLEKKFERDNLLQHSFNLNYENGSFSIDPSFDFWWKEISNIIRVKIYERISNIFLYFFLIFYFQKLSVINNKKIINFYL